MTVTTNCGVNLPEVEETFPVILYRVGDVWEEFLRGSGFRKVEELDEDFVKKISQAVKTMYERRGIGIAANQVGFKENWCVIDVDWTETDEKKPIVMINPSIISKSDEDFEEEGCLSVPLSFRGKAKRFGKVVVAYKDLNNNMQQLQADGLLAQAIQHELDHLNGKLFIDYLSKLRLSFLEKKIKKARKLAAIKLKEHNKQIVEQVKQLNMKYTWSKQRKKDERNCTGDCGRLVDEEGKQIHTADCPMSEGSNDAG